MSVSKYITLTFFISFVCTVGYCQQIKGNFAIKNQASGLLLRPLDASKKNETPIVGYTPTNWKCMTWDFQLVSGNVYNLRNLFTNKTFQPSSAAAEGVTLKQEPLSADILNQQWEFIPVGKQVYLIRLKDSAWFVTASSNNINSNIILSKRRNDDTQYWTIYEQDPQY